ncbi:hypothetical protein B0T11DRAFT_125381 [Plectosphaerella cucumerina]|uniref:NB-ARC domain-containing protein n=1 Tax=Plectosphaerella cucumerina TaxID=40658 RepID=A0A8K0TB35_9PEZI|nr:hypothetical protein B0T11DRAFT_125381 [Plectosphaerella cucumerina]
MANHDDGIRSMDDIRFGDSSIANQGNVGVLHHDNIRFRADPSANQMNYHANNQTNTHNYYGTPTPGTPPVQACVRVGLPPRNANRVERKDLFRELEQMLPRGEEHYPVALWGLPGSGKTQLALHYAYQRFDPKKCSVFWVQAKDENTIIDSFRTMARKAGFGMSAEDREMLLYVREWIESQPTWLMVIDGADDVEVFTRNISERVRLCEFIPDGPNGTVIWTSQDRRILEVVGWTRGLKVDSMNPDEAVSLLEITANHGKPFNSTGAAQVLVLELGYNPLVISHVAATMRAHVAPEEMLSRLKDPRTRSEIFETRRIDLGTPQGVSRSILSMLIGQVESLATHDPEAYRIIAMVAYMDRYTIPLDIFLDSNGPGGDRPVRRAIARLKDLSLILESPMDVIRKTFHVNGLIQEAIRHHLDQRTILDDMSKVCGGRRDQANLSSHVCFRSQAITALLRINPYERRHSTSLPRHVLNVCLWGPYEMEARVEMANLLKRAGDCMSYWGGWRDMATPYQKALRLRVASFGATDSRTIDSMDSLGHAHMKLGNYKRALESFENARHARNKSLGLPETHPDITGDLNIGVARRKLGQLSLAKTLLTKNLDLRIQNFGVDHAETALGMFEMSQLGRVQGAHGWEMELLQKSLRIQTVLLEASNARTMETKMRLGSLLDLMGDGVRGKKLHKEVLDFQSKSFGDRHPLTMEAKLRCITARYSSEDNADRSLQVASEVAAASADKLGRAHPLTLRARGILASLLSNVRQDYAEAAAIQRSTLDIYVSQLGRTHYLSLEMQVSLAKTLFSQGEMIDSKKLATPAHGALCAQFGKDDARTIAAAELLDRLANVLEED